MNVNTLLTRKESRVLTSENSSTSLTISTSPLSILFDKPITPNTWSTQQLDFWLESNNFEYLKDVFKGVVSDSTDSNNIWIRHDFLNNFLQVKGGKVSKLIKWLCITKDDPICKIFNHYEFVREWFMTFHSFTTPTEFLREISSRFKHEEEDEDEDKTSSRINGVAEILMIWVSIEHAADFALDNDLYKRCVKFIEKMKEKLPEKALAIKKTLDHQIHLFKNPPPIDTKNAPNSIVPKHEHIDIMELDLLEIARQMTLMESNLFRQLRAKEFLKVSWTKKNAQQIAPNLFELIELVNHFSNWIITEILKQKTFEQMAELIIKFIKVTKNLEALNNFSGIMQIVTALSNSSISRLKPAWALVPIKKKEEFEVLSELVTPLGHYKKYRDAFKNRDSNLPCLPILAATLSDLNGYEEVFASTTKDGVNWVKMNKISARIFENLSIYSTFELKSVASIQNYIKNASVWKDGLTTCAIANLHLQEIPKQLEVKEKDKRNSKRRSVSGYIGEVDIGPRDDLSDHDWQILVTGADAIRTYKKDQVILESGKQNDYLFRIRKGTVRIIKEINGVEVNVGTMGENAMFGEVSMLLRSEREGTITASIIADEEVELWVLDIEYVMQLLSAKPLLAAKLNRIVAIKLARRLRDLGKKPDDLPKDSKTAAIALMSPSKKEEKKKLDPNLQFNKKFGLEGEVLFRQTTCSLKVENKVSSDVALYISQNYICLLEKLFGSRQRRIIPISQIQQIKNKTKYISINILDHNNVQVELKLSNIEGEQEVLNMINSIWSHQSSVKKSNVQMIATSEVVKKSKSKNLMLPTDEHWNIILKGARIGNFKKDDILIKENDQINTVFQLIRGQVRFEKLVDNAVCVLGTMATDGTNELLFGEISFLEGGKASASVLCDKDDTQIAIIEGYWLDALFQYYPELSGRFFHYLARVLSKRLKQRETTINSAQPSNTTNTETGEKKKRKKKEKRESSERSSASEIKENIQSDEE